ncbi:YciI family protein [Oryzobacter terrae]|uniref:YciI family protein n=1 Tax=Oryzobacter terrae TaxID=1620385 RepID=UPI00366E81E7
MTTYAILLPGDEDHWGTADAAERARVYGEHERFSAALAERGHRVVGGAELAHSREARTVRPGPDGPVVSDGPYAETTEQLTGFYLVESEDLDDLLEVCGILAAIGDSLEVRAFATGTGA